MVWLYSMVKKFEYMFIRFDRMHERDRQTPHDDIGRACTASRVKKTTGRFVLLKLTTDRHEALRGLFAIAELLVPFTFPFTIFVHSMWLVD